MSTKQEVVDVLRSVRDEIKPVVSLDLNDPNAVVFDFTEGNAELNAVDLENTQAFTDYTFSLMEKAHTPVGIGKYNENRTIYARSKLFAGAEPRTVHLAIDIWAEAGTPIHSPLPARIHSFQNNDRFGDYGPTIVLEHTVNGVTFYTLYGHLSKVSLEGLSVGKEIAAGEKFCELGPAPENGDYPPHLHFQLITDMQGKTGDFPGVCAPSEREKFLEICLDPNLILKIARLES